MFLNKVLLLYAIAGDGGKYRWRAQQDGGAWIRIEIENKISQPN
jgi:hypothetical protein